MNRTLVTWLLCHMNTICFTAVKQSMFTRGPKSASLWFNCNWQVSFLIATRPQNVWMNECCYQIHRWPSTWQLSVSAVTIIWSPWRTGPRLNITTVVPRCGDSHVKDKTVEDRLILNMGILILVRRHLYIETASCSLPQACSKPCPQNSAAPL